MIVGSEHMTSHEMRFLYHVEQPIALYQIPIAPISEDVLFQYKDLKNKARKP